jgi:hypothetical protein
MGQRDDGLLTPPVNLKEAGRRSLHKKLLKLGVVEEVPILSDLPTWRESADDRFGLKITGAGLTAIGLDADAPSKVTIPPSIASAASAASDLHPQPRSGSKIASVLALLQREEGATLGELTAATGWLPHTVRAALTGLRKRGHAVALNASDTRRAYRVAVGQAEGVNVSPAAAEEAR